VLPPSALGDQQPVASPPPASSSGCTSTSCTADGMVFITSNSIPIRAADSKVVIELGLDTSNLTLSSTAVGAAAPISPAHDSGIINQQAAIPAPVPQPQLSAPPAPQPTQKDLLAIRVAFRGDFQQLFGSGTLLGVGGEGEVRRIELEGFSFAVKQASVFTTKAEANLSRTALAGGPWIHLPLVTCQASSSCVRYSLYTLAAGDLQHGLMGRQEEHHSSRQHGAAAASPQQLWSPSELKGIAAEMVTAVSLLHSVDYRHADIKPRTS